MNNSLVLAYLGDSIYEVYVRKYLISKNICKVKELQEKAIEYVSANAQEKYLKLLLDNNFFTDGEINVIKRARNHKSNHKPKYASIITYKNATGLEAIIGYLYLNKQNERINELMNYILEGSLC